MIDFNKKAWSEFVAKYYGDSSYASEVDKDPAAALRSAGIPIPDGKTVCLHKPPKDGKLHIGLPPDPTSKVSNEDLHEIYAGECAASSSSSSAEG